MMLKATLKNYVSRRFIAHRGNTTGPVPDRENHPDHIKDAMGWGFDVEIDVWYAEDSTYLLGHDNMEYPIDKKFLEDPRLWCHAKNTDAFYQMLKNPNIHCFFHQKDDVTLTSKGYIWTFPGIRLYSQSVCVMPENSYVSLDDLKKCAGICSDNISEYRKRILR